MMLENTQQDDFDLVMAQLLMLVTQHSLTGCASMLEPIVERLERLCRHSELEFYPHQRDVMLKMRQILRVEHTRLQLKH